MDKLLCLERVVLRDAPLPEEVDYYVDVVLCQRLVMHWLLVLARLVALLPVCLEAVHCRVVHYPQLFLYHFGRAPGFIYWQIRIGYLNRVATLRSTH